MKAQHTLFVCTTCASAWKDGKRVGTSGGEKLLEQLQEQHACWELHEEFVLQPVQCMSVCSRSCAICFVANGKSTYLFGDLLPDSPSEILNVLDCAKKYYNHPQGLLPWAERPEPLKKGILARIPTLSLTSEF